MAIAAIAQLTDPGSATALLLLAPAVIAFVVRGLWSRMPSELFAAVVVGSVVLAVSTGDGDLEAAQFLPVVMLLYAAWHLRSRHPGDR